MIVKLKDGRLGLVAATHRRNGKVTGYRIKLASGAIAVVSPEDVEIVSDA